MANAAMRGVRWLLDHKTAIPGHLGLAAYRKIYKVTADDALAEDLLETIREREALLPPVESPIDIEDRRLLQWHYLHPVLTDLLRSKCAGQAYEEDAETVRVLVESDWDSMFPSTMHLSQKIVGAYLLDKLGIGREGRYHAVRSEIRSRRDLMASPGEHYYTSYLYALTHIVLTGSGYYEHYVDPSQYGFEIDAFRMAIQHFASSEDLTSTEIDVAAEILICLKLLGVAPDEPAEGMYQRLVELQNPDGSWGSGSETGTAKVHTTAVATMALLDFAPEFRRGDIFCDSPTYR